MPLNYSKWDQLEVSDDSDIEGHPDVDKKSLIRQCSHLNVPQVEAATSTRSGRRAKIVSKQLSVEVACNDVLLARLRVLQPKLAQSGSSYFSSEVDRLRTNPSPEAPPTDAAKPYDEMTLTPPKYRERGTRCRVHMSPLFLRTTTISFRIVLGS
ncbi:Cdc37 N terminal kinase binding-domain-containing protein, partial [Lactarius deliciosus]